MLATLSLGALRGLLKRLEASGSFWGTPRVSPDALKSAAAADVYQNGLAKLEHLFGLIAPPVMKSQFRCVGFFFI